LPWRPIANHTIPTTASQPAPKQPQHPQHPQQHAWPPPVPPTMAQAPPPRQFPQPQQGHAVIRAAFPSSEQGQPLPTPQAQPMVSQPQAQPPAPQPVRQPQVQPAPRPQQTPAPQGKTAIEKLKSMSLAAHPEFRERIGNEHPIMPALRWAKAGLPYVEAL